MHFIQYIFGFISGDFFKLHAQIQVNIRTIIPKIPGINKQNVVLASDILTGKVQAGKNTVVCGGGMIGGETATHLAMTKRLDFNNRQVTVIEIKSDIAVDEEYTRRIELYKLLDELKINLMTDTKVVEIQDDGVVVEVNGELEKLSCETIVLAIWLFT